MYDHGPNHSQFNPIICSMSISSNQVLFSKVRFRVKTGEVEMDFEVSR